MTTSSSSSGHTDSLFMVSLLGLASLEPPQNPPRGTRTRRSTRSHKRPTLRLNLNLNQMRGLSRVVHFGDGGLDQERDEPQWHVTPSRVARALDPRGIL